MSFTRQTLYPGQQPESARIMTNERNQAKAAAQWIADALGGTAAKFSGLTASPGTGLAVSLAPGSLYQFGEIDPTNWAGLTADASGWILQGISPSSVAITGFTAPASAGYSTAYLIEAQIQVTDNTPENLPFYNSVNPLVPTYISDSPSRQNVIVFQIKAGTPATTGRKLYPRRRDRSAYAHHGIQSHAVRGDRLSGRPQARRRPRARLSRDSKR